MVLCFMFSPSKAGVEELYKYQMFDANSEGEGEHKGIPSDDDDDEDGIKMEDIKVIEFQDHNVAHNMHVEEEIIGDDEELWS